MLSKRACLRLSKFVVLTTIFVCISLHLANTPAHVTQNASRPGGGESIQRSKKVRPRVAIVFYGLSRSLSHTYDSIRTNILAVLEENNIEYRIFMHSVIFEGTYSNLRSEEVGVTFNKTEWQLLRPDVVIHESHDNFVHDHVEMFQKILKFGDPYRNDGFSTRNEIEALHSLKRGVHAAQNDHFKFDGMLILRPDLIYLEHINVSTLSWAMAQGFVVSPSWQRYKGENDRFAYGAWLPMQLVGTRFQRIEDYCNTTSLPWHAERFLSWVLIKSGIAHCCVEQRAARVRATGVMKIENFRESRGCAKCETLMLSTNV